MEVNKLQQQQLQQQRNTIYVINYANEAEAALAETSVWLHAARHGHYNGIICCLLARSGICADRYETHKYYIGMLICTICH